MHLGWKLSCTDSLLVQVEILIHVIYVFIFNKYDYIYYAFITSESFTYELHNGSKLYHIKYSTDITHIVHVKRRFIIIESQSRFYLQGIGTRFDYRIIFKLSY